MIDSRFRLHMQAQRSSFLKASTINLSSLYNFGGVKLSIPVDPLGLYKSWMGIFLHCSSMGFVVPFRCNMASRKVSWISLPQADSFFCRLHGNAPYVTCRIQLKPHHLQSWFASAFASFMVVVVCSCKMNLCQKVFVCVWAPAFSCAWKKVFSWFMMKLQFLAWHTPSDIGNYKIAWNFRRFFQMSGSMGSFRCQLCSN